MDTKETVTGATQKDSLKNESPSGVAPRLSLTNYDRYAKDYLLDLPKSIAYMQGGVVTGLNIRQIPGGWQAIVKRTRRERGEVAFLEADTWPSLLSGVAEWTERALWKWYPDKYF